jgi:hypothetical protein
MAYSILHTVAGQYLKVTFDRDTRQVRIDDPARGLRIEFALPIGMNHIPSISLDPDGWPLIDGNRVTGEVTETWSPF